MRSVRTSTPLTRAGLLLAGAAIAGVCACAPSGEQPPDPSLRPQAAERPSVVLITLDTTRADRLQPYGADDVETPALAALAAGGVVFEHAVATVPVTAPAHASLLTGLYPTRHGVRNNSTHHLRDDLPTLTEALAASGYRTAAFVSTVILDHRYGLDQGFEIYDDEIRSSAALHDRRMTVERPARATTDRVIEWLDELDGRSPFFLWVHYYDPHIPYAPPPPWSETYSDRPYDGEIASMDNEIGRLLDHPMLARDRTVVAAIGDHGESLGEHGEKTHGLLVYDSTLRVPWILRFPAGPAGVRIAAPISQVDLAPTILELLDLAPSAAAGELDGKSLLPLINGAPPTADRPIFAESEVPFFAYGWSPLQSVRRGSLKLIAAPRPELYDLERDPSEIDNLAPARSAEVRRLTALIDDWLAARDNVDSTVAVDAETANMLGALGYVAGDAGRPAGEGRGNPVELMAVHDELQEVGKLLTSGDPPAAVAAAGRALEKDPDNLAGLQDLSRGLVLIGKLDEAAEAAARATAVAPWSAQALTIEADVEYRRGRVEQALDRIDRALELNPRSLEARIERCRYLAALGRFDAAAAALQALLEEFPHDNWVALRYAEIVELGSGGIGAAERRLRDVLSRNPSFSEASLLLGTLLTDTARPGEAIEVYREAVAHGAVEPAVRGRLEVLLASRFIERGDWAEAEVHARTAVEHQPGSAAAWNTFAVVVDELGRPAEAETAYRRAAELDPNDWRALFNLGILLRENRRYDEAASVQEQVLARSPGNPGANFELGVLWAVSLGDADRARRHLQATIDADPAHPRAEQARILLQRLR